MSLIDKTVLLGIADRASYQYKALYDGWSAASLAGGGFYFDRVTSTDDKDVELPTIDGYNNVDQSFINDFSKYIRFGTQLCNIVVNMESHFSRKDTSGATLQVGGWDGYLFSHNERVSWWFSQLFYSCHDYYMLAKNVFSESDDKFATLEVDSTPSIVFTDGVNYGTGEDSNAANGDNFAGTQLKALVVSMGGTDLDVRLNVKDLNNNPTTIDFNVPAGTLAGTEISIGTTSDRFLDVIGANLIPASSYGTIGDTIEIFNIKERLISL